MRKRLLPVAVAVVAMAAVALTTSAAFGGGHSTAAATLDCTSIFSPAAAWLDGESSVFRGGFPEPDLKAGPSDSEIPHGNDQNPSPSFQATVPVYVHVVRGLSATGALVGDVTDAQIAQQIVELNRGFSGYYDVVNDAHTDPGKTVTGFSFTLAGVDRTTNDAWWRGEPGTPEEFAMKGALKRGGPTTLNLYITSGAGYLGWAYYPKINVWQKKYAVLDGVVVNYGSLPGGFIPFYNLGFTATHEVGHWLGLYHTFAPEPFGCRGDSDRIDDTPPCWCRPEAVRSARTRARSPGSIPIHNYMDYSYDACYTEFSTGPGGADAGPVLALAPEAGVARPSGRGQAVAGPHRPDGPRFRRVARPSDVEADVQDVAVGDDVRLALEPLRAAPRCLGVGAGAPAGRRPRITSQRMKPRAMSVWIVAAASRAVCPSRSVQARVSLSPTVKKAISPSASFNLRTTSSSAEGPSRNSAASSSGRSASSASSLQSIPCGPFSTARSGFVVSGSSSGGSSPGQSASVFPASRCASSATSVSSSARFAGVARLRLLRDALVPALDVIAIGDEQLELERLEVVGGRRVRREAVEHREDRVDLAQVAEQRRARARDVDDADRRRRHLPGRDERARAAGGGRRRSPPSRRSASRSRTRTR